MFCCLNGTLGSSAVISMRTFAPARVAKQEGLTELILPSRQPSWLYRSSVIRYARSTSLPGGRRSYSMTSMYRSCTATHRTSLGDGSRISAKMRCWPISFVEFHALGLGALRHRLVVLFAKLIPLRQRLEEVQRRAIARAFRIRHQRVADDVLAVAVDLFRRVRLRRRVGRWLCLFRGTRGERREHEQRRQQRWDQNAFAH